MFKRVGATSARMPVTWEPCVIRLFSGAASLLAEVARIKGTGLAVWSLVRLPAWSSRASALPWSAVKLRLPLIALISL